MSSERRREREVLKYYQSWLEAFDRRSDVDQAYLAHVSRNNGSATKSSRDKALVAFAQLGCHRLNVRRGMIHLISSNRIYVLAEATRTTSLLSDHTHATGDDLWFGEASLPRVQGISEHALDPPSYTVKDESGLEYSTPALVIDDIRTSPYSVREYAGNGVCFYAGVPIMSRSGFPIGVFTVNDDRPRAGLSAEELRFLHDMAVTTIDHLDGMKNNSARYRGERLISGLGLFIEGRSTTHDAAGANGPTPTPALHAPEAEEGKTGELLRTFKGMNISKPPSSRDAEQDRDLEMPAMSHRRIIKTVVGSRRPLLGDRISSQSIAPLKGREAVSKSFDLDHAADEDDQHSSISNEVKQTFARAANILRECTGADGVVFHDATSTNLGTAPHPDDANETMPTMPGSSDDLSAGSSDDGSSRRSSQPSSGSEDGGNSFSGESRPQSNCQMLGLSFDTSTLAKGRDTLADHLVLSRRNIRRLIRRYPHGKIFHYTQDGQISSSDSEPPDHRATQGLMAPPVAPPSKSHEKGSTGRAVADELLKVVPGARNVIFLPLWDFNKEKWGAGCFVWSHRAESLLTAQDDLSYMRAFGHSIMSEIARIDATVAEKAKTSFIANISHELRSPLHGILGSIEFLHETMVEDFQSAMITTVETCSKTLLDTVEHVLDYAKINHLTKASTSKKASKSRGGLAGFGAPGTVTKNFNLATIVEEVVEAIYAGQTFRSAASFHEGASDSDSAAHVDSDTASPTIKENAKYAREQSERHRTAAKFSGAVRLILNIERRDDWNVRGPPGGVRRVVMNLLGNALKYTEKGEIEVSLKAAHRKTDDPSTLSCCFTVQDTGRGMSAEFVNNRAFTAFTQEDSFSSGTGLGLSIVQQIVRSMGGKIDLQSQKNVGTHIRIWLTFPLADAVLPLDRLDILDAVTQRTSGLKMCLLDPSYTSDRPAKIKGEQDSGDAFDNWVRTLAHGWFGMEIIRSSTMKDVDAAVFLYSEPPQIEYLMRNHGRDVGHASKPLIIMTPNAYETASLKARGVQELTSVGRTIEVISQPCGPHKLARALYRCLREPETPNGDHPPPAEPEPEPIPDDEKDAVAPEAVKRAPLQLPKEAMTPASGWSKSPLSTPGIFESRQLSAYFAHLESGANSPGDEGRGASKRPALRRKLTRGVSYSANVTDPDAPPMPELPGPVLLVDDNEINLSLLVASVRKANYRYEQARNGQEAVEAYKRASSKASTAFKFICMDVTMPVMDGLTATRQIRAFERKNMLPRVHIIALTGLASDVAQEEAFDSGVDEFLPKPVKFEQLIKLLGTKAG